MKHLKRKLHKCLLFVSQRKKKKDIFFPQPFWLFGQFFWIMIALKSFIITWKEQVFLAIFIEIKKRRRRYFYPFSYFWWNPLGVVNCPTPSNFALIGNTLLLLSFCFLFYHVNWRCPNLLHTAMTKNVKQI